MRGTAIVETGPALDTGLNIERRDVLRARANPRSIADQNARPQSATLWLYLHLPALPLEVLTRGVEETRAFVLASESGRRRVVEMTNRCAASLGVRVGMPLSAAHALGEIQVLERRSRAEHKALQRLAMWAMQITSQVSVVEPDGLLLEVKGSLKLFKGVDALLRRLRRSLKQLGYRADYAVAPTPAAAMVLARSNPRKVILQNHQLHSALARLPVSALRLEAKQTAALESLGAKFIGECRRLPRDGIARRLSPELLTRLDQLYGEKPDPQLAFQAPRSFDAEIDLPWDVDNARDLLTAGERLLDELQGYLTANTATIRALRWRLIGCDNKLRFFDLRLSHATRDRQHMLLLLRETLSRMNLTSPVRGIGLNVAEVTFGAKLCNRDLFDPNQRSEQEAYASFIDRLRSRCGETALRRLGIEGHHKPEATWRWLQPAVMLEHRNKGLAHLQAQRVARPLWLLKKALKLKQNGGQPHFDGPLELVPERERIVNGWWDETAIARDYFVAKTSRGGRLWVYRELGMQANWYLHGIFE